MIADFSTRLEAIEARNRRVADDKAWETSWLRRGSIAGITYVSAVVLLAFLGHDAAFLQALVPVLGYLLSTLSLPVIKSIWLKHHHKV